MVEVKSTGRPALGLLTGELRRLSAALFGADEKNAETVGRCLYQLGHFLILFEGFTGPATQRDEMAVEAFHDRFKCAVGVLVDFAEGSFDSFKAERSYTAVLFTVTGLLIRRRIAEWPQ